MLTNVNTKFSQWIAEQIEWLKPEVETARSTLASYGLDEEQIDRCCNNDLVNMEDIKQHLIEIGIITDSDVEDDEGWDALNTSAVGDACIHTHHLTGIEWAKDEFESGSDLFWVLDVLEDEYSVTYEDPILQRQVEKFNTRFNQSPIMQIRYVRDMLEYEITSSAQRWSVDDLLCYGFRSDNQNVLRGFTIMETDLHVFNRSEVITENDRQLLAFLGAHCGAELDDRDFVEKVMVILHAWAEGENVLYTVLGC